MILVSQLHCKTGVTWEYMFFAVPIIKLRMFGSYVSIIGASKEAKPRLLVFIPYFLIAQINKVW